MIVSRMVTVDARGPHLALLAVAVLHVSTVRKVWLLQIIDAS